MQLLLSEIIHKASRMNPMEACKFLRGHDSVGLRRLLALAYNRSLDTQFVYFPRDSVTGKLIPPSWEKNSLPPGMQGLSLEKVLVDNRLNIFFAMHPQNRGLTKLGAMRLQKSFVRLLESLQDADADLLVNAIFHKTVGIEGFDGRSVNNVFPGAIPEDCVVVLEDVPEVTLDDFQDVSTSTPVVDDIPFDTNLSGEIPQDILEDDEDHDAPLVAVQKEPKKKDVLTYDKAKKMFLEICPSNRGRQPNKFKDVEIKKFMFFIDSQIKKKAIKKDCSLPELVKAMMEETKALSK